MATVVNSTRPSVGQLIEAFNYDPKTGDLIWKQCKRHDRTGKRAGCQNNLGYTKVRILGFQTTAHRIAYAVSHGCWPVEVHHENIDPTDTRLANLHEVSRSRNLLLRRLLVA
jgi:HNH endonuclease